MKTTTLRTLTLIAAATVAPSVSHALNYDGSVLRHDETGSVLGYGSSPYFLDSNVDDTFPGRSYIMDGVLVADGITLNLGYWNGSSDSGILEISSGMAPAALVLQNGSVGFFEGIHVYGGVDTQFVLDNSTAYVNQTLQNLYGGIVVRNGGVLHIRNNNGWMAGTTNVQIGQDPDLWNGFGTVTLQSGAMLQMGDYAVMDFQFSSLVIEAGSHIVNAATPQNVGWLTLTEYATLTVGLDGSMANAGVGVAPIQVRTDAYSAKLSVDANGIWFDPGDEFTLVHSLIGVNCWFEGLIDPSVVTSDTGQIFAMEARQVSAGYDDTIVLVATANAIPEPSTYALLGGVCAVALAVLRRRRRG
ncbi:MAG: PEP-CTERM sorting domain-containing protein [Puniceicoccales bacterium]|jgi:hypothetical protein|nr:PEP-CTERM sorting domain-containing protein [Puniceicoccales bacterium]